MLWSLYITIRKLRSLGESSRSLVGGRGTYFDDMTRVDRSPSVRCKNAIGLKKRAANQSRRDAKGLARGSTSVVVNGEVG